MILRGLNMLVICALILAAAYVYRIKFNSTVQAERLAKIRGEERSERDSIAALRAKWGELDNPARIQTLAKRYLKLKVIAPTQFDSLDHLPDRPPVFIKPDSKDPIAVMIENLPASDTAAETASASVTPSTGASTEATPAPAPAVNAMPAADN